MKTLVQDNKKLADSTGLDDQRHKRMDYTYDLISGNVHQVSFQKDSVDAFHHKYEYDADNRITEVYTSRHHDPHPEATSVWENDAKYFYYAHGPLARVELGDLKVQGMDYVYTLQGWIKGVNSSTLDSLRDPGLDGWVDNSNVNKYIPKDVMGYNLNYFTGDYAAINTAKSGASAPFASIVGSDIESNRYDLYNGNIGSMVTTITNPTTREVLPLGNAYQYDQLNRIKQARSFTNLDVANNIWQSGSTYSGKYENTFNYDANGNILGQLRKDHAGSVIDSLTYRYARNTNNRIIRNRLYHVNDNTDYNSNDIDDMGTFTSSLSTINTANNYSYTAIGELAKDEQEEIEEIQWTVSGKVKAIYRPDSSSKKELRFDYDINEQKIAFHVYSSSGQWEKSIYYVRDASGNVLSTYEHILIDSLEEISFRLSEQHIYGSSRIGIITAPIEMIGAQNDTNNFYRKLGYKNYEIPNHIGNVITVISDKLIPVDDENDGLVNRYKVELISSQDYSPFGAVLENRNFNSSQYRYSFNGLEFISEIELIEADFRVFNPQLGRWLTIDPRFRDFSYQSPYCGFDNNPILFEDPSGAGTDEEDIKDIEENKGAYQAAEIAYQGLKKKYGGYKGVKALSKEQLQEELKAFAGQGEFTEAFNQAFERITSADEYLNRVAPRVAEMYDRYLSDPSLTMGQMISIQKARRMSVEDERANALMETSALPYVWALMSYSPFSRALVPHQKLGGPNGNYTSKSGFGSGDPAILPYKEAQKLTRGFKGSIQAHHIVESRHLRRLGMGHLVREAPAIVLTRAEHQAITRVLNQLLKLGNTYEKEVVLEAYRIAYKDFPTWIKAAENFLK
ncbi:MAG TPA: RHS repeat-associated core domain-containing protein [Flavobacteriales bacterium]|nr:RHS repeat-associated core domain-containing protein [Flavobacteriales bacterium]